MAADGHLKTVIFTLGQEEKMKPFPKRMPWILLALLVGGPSIFSLNAFFPVPVETVFAFVGMSVFFVGFFACIVGVIWAFRTLASAEGRQASGIVAPVVTILIAFVTWSGVVASAVAVKQSMDARQDPPDLGAQTEEMK
jgi:hypothetical protein